MALGLRRGLLFGQAFEMGSEAERFGLCRNSRSPAASVCAWPWEAAAASESVRACREIGGMCDGTR